MVGVGQAVGGVSRFVTPFEVWCRDSLLQPESTQYRDRSMGYRISLPPSLPDPAPAGR